jgi:phosphotransferase system HPr-like phosphotransfer protein
MIRTDKDALICDLAETYHVYDYKALPVSLVASLVIGLREDSRIKMKLSGAKAPSEIILLASIIDRLSVLVWMQTKDAQKGRNRPKSLMSLLFPKETKATVYKTGEDFEKARKKLIEGM